MTQKFIRSLQLYFYVETRDKWIGLYHKDDGRTESSCQYTLRTYFICLLPCLVIQFDRKIWTQHAKICYHKNVNPKLRAKK